jgi:hypothetical protein
VPPLGGREGLGDVREGLDPRVRREPGDDLGLGIWREVGVRPGLEKRLERAEELGGDLGAGVSSAASPLTEGWS